MSDFEKRSEKINRDFQIARRRSFAFDIFWTIVYLMLIGFGIWVIIMLMRFWQVI